MDRKFFLTKGIIYLEGQLGKSEAVEIIGILSKLDQRHIDVIKIYVALEDADFSASLMLVDVIKSLKTPVKTYAISYLGGYSSYIFLPGNERVALKHSVINFPRFDLAIFGSKNELINFNHFREKIKNNLKNTYTNLTGQDVFEEFLIEDRFMKSEEMLRRNIATEIIGG